MLYKNRITIITAIIVIFSLFTGCNNGGNNVSMDKLYDNGDELS